MGLVENSIGLLIAVVVVAAVTIPVINDTLVLDQKTTINETFNATSDPYTYTVNDASQSDFWELAKVTCYESTAQSTEQTCEILDAEAGDVNVSGAVDGDDESIDYSWNPQNYVQNDTSRLVLGFVVVGAAVGLLVAAFSFGR